MIRRVFFFFEGVQTTTNTARPDQQQQEHPQHLTTVSFPNVFPIRLLFSFLSRKDIKLIPGLMWRTSTHNNWKKKKKLNPLDSSSSLSRVLLSDPEENNRAVCRERHLYFSTIAFCTVISIRPLKKKTHIFHRFSFSYFFVHRILCSMCVQSFCGNWKKMNSYR